MSRARAAYAALVLGTIAVGLLVHWHGNALGATGRDVLGDALWAVMVAWGIGALKPDVRVGARAAVAFAVCVAVEVSQLIHTPALDALRNTAAGHLVLGSGFDSRDLVAYALGVAGAVLLERMVARRTERPRTAI